MLAGSTASLLGKPTLFGQPCGPAQNQAISSLISSVAYSASVALLSSLLFVHADQSQTGAIPNVEFELTGILKTKCLAK